MIPTFGERRIGGLICGEHLTPLVRAAMIQLGEEIHIAAFPGSLALHSGPRLEEPDLTGNFWGISSTRNHAFEAGAFVVSACSIIDPEDVPDSFPYAGKMNIDYANGGSGIINPLGVPIVDPVLGSEIIFADCQAWMIKAVEAIIDTAGHHSRPDLLALAARGEAGWEVLSRERRLPQGWGRQLLRATEAWDVDPEQLPEAAKATLTAAHGA